LPDAPTGLKFFSRVGMEHLTLELIYFLPFTLYALWPWRHALPGFRRPRPRAQEGTFA
jgi:hypothetical protein